ncbi:hypothetical protein FK268_18360 [Tsukamurella sputi]|uniref:PE domain-containing protein n=1 Tax=Tsukamurella sputi TaxID=2591848 RepID=A0A5C5RJB1_9ACTN|nr:hypothetical protein [Tsukamurella sputi]TWS22692.1 hypothetical protein FK268_18360 [Tsukamurella sputi]
MADEDLDRMMALARVAIQDRPNMVSDGNPQEQLARAFERHANRVDSAAYSLREVGQQNNLGPTVEGEAATHNIRLGAYEHDRSLYNSMRAQAADARAIADALRDIGRQLLRTEGTSEAEIRRLIGG